MIVVVQILLVLLGLIFILYLQRFLSRSSNLFVLIIGIGIICFVLVPDWLSQLANLLGIGRGVDLAFYIVIPILAIIAIRSAVKTKENQRKIIDLSRKQAIRTFKTKYNK